MVKAASFFELNSEVSLSAGHDRMVVFARRESGELAHISEVDNGKCCGCFCLACQEALIARQGAVREHSFAHQSGTQCQHAMDAMLHGVVHRLIEQHRYFVTPEMRVMATIPGPHGPITDSRLQPPIKVPVDSVALVERAPWRHRCVEACVKGHTVLLHLALKRRTQQAKCDVLAQTHQAAIEIDLSGQVARTVGDLARMLFTADKRKTWLFNPKSEAIQAELLAGLKPVADRQWTAHRAAEEHRHQVEQQRAQALVLATAARERESAARLSAFMERQAAYLAEQDRLSAEPEPARAVRQHARPPRMSPAVEYASPAGRLVLLHNSDTDSGIFFRLDSEAKILLDVLCRQGAVLTADPGIWCMSVGGWSMASIELSRTWTTISTIEAISEPQTQAINPAP